MTSFTFYLLLNKKSNEREIINLSKITKIPGIARSTSFLEHRVQCYTDVSNRLYPKMQYYKQMDFVYAQ
jgi:hypothetical protein